MTREEILKEIKRLISTLFEIEPDVVTAESRLGQDLDLDSIDAIDLIIKMQDMTGQKVDPEAMKTLRTVGDIADMIEQLTAEGT